MNDLAFPSSTPATFNALQNAAAQAAAAACNECLGSGGWFRYEPALEPAPGMLYLSCVRCRGTGRTGATAEPRG